MNAEKQPQCYVVAGPNGAGKTTFALTYLPVMVSCHDFINADEIAKGLSPLDFEAGLLKAGKIFLEILDQKIKGRKDFAFETTLSGRTYLSRIRQWRKSGWKVVLFYLYIPNAEFSAMRVQQRVLQGGHNIPGMIFRVDTRAVFGTCSIMPKSAIRHFVLTTPAARSSPYLKNDSECRWKFMIPNGSQDCREG